MFLHIGSDVSVPFSSVVGVFDMDNTTSSKHTREFLREAEKTGKVINVNEDLPKSFIVIKDDTYGKGYIVYISQISPRTLWLRLERGKITDNSI